MDYPVESGRNLTLKTKDQVFSVIDTTLLKCYLNVSKQVKIQNNKPLNTVFALDILKVKTEQIRKKICHRKYVLFMNYFKYYLYKTCFYVCKRMSMFCVGSLRHFFLHTKHMFDRKKLIIIILGGYIFLCLPPYNSNFRLFEINL